MKFFPQTDAFILKSVTELQNLVSACNWYTEPNRTQLVPDLPDSVWKRIYLNLMWVFHILSEFIVYAISFDLYYIFDMIETSVFCLKQII